MGLPLRPLEIKQLFDFAIRTYRARFVPIVLLTAIAQAPMAAATTLLFYHLTIILKMLETMAESSEGSSDFPGDAMLGVLSDQLPTWIIVGTVFALAALFQLALLPLVNVAVSRLVACYLSGEECTAREALSFAGERYWATQVALATYLLPLLVLALIVLLPVAALSASGDPAAIGLSAGLAVFLIWLGSMVTWALYFRFFPALTGAVQALEDPPLGTRGAGSEGLWFLKRSYGLTARFFWRCAGLTTLFSFALGFIQRGVNESVRLLVWLIWLPSNMPDAAGEQQLIALAESVDNPVVVAWTLAITSLFLLLTPGLTLCYQNLLYWDLRFRREGLDLELLLDRAGKVRPRETVSTVPVGNVGI